MPSTTPDLLATIESANAAYRGGNPIMSDSEYDALTEALRELDPEHPFLHRVEPESEGVFGGEEVAHESPMLSTDKAYSVDNLRAFFRRVESMAQAIGFPVENIRYTATPKLDGLSGRLYHRVAGVDGPVLATRGNGFCGTNITRAMDRGLRMEGHDMAKDWVDGEIVMDEEYFQTVLKPQGFKMARNFMVGFVSADTLQAHHLPLRDNGMGRFVAYETLPTICGYAPIFLSNIESVSGALRGKNCPYATDGIVISVDQQPLRDALGATSHHHRWQIAYKTKAETAETTVVDLHWQTGRTGRVTPVIEVEPVELSGATVHRATAHTAQMVKRLGVGPGSRITLIRSGEVIPKIEEVLESAPVELATHCPSCGHVLEEDGEYLVCPSVYCDAQAEGRIIHFFKTLGNADGFGPKAAERLVDDQATDLAEILRLNAQDLVGMGFGPGQAKNLVEEIARCIQTPVEDWRFLAAFGIRHLGRGDSRHLLAALPDFDALGHLDWETIASVDGFAEKTAKSIATDLGSLWPKISAIRNMGFTLLPSRQAQVACAGLPLAGKALVFTGTFSVPREELEAEAARMGAQVQSAVNKKTTAVVVGDKPGASKRKKAEELSIPMWTEAEYQRLVNFADL